MVFTLTGVPGSGKSYYLVDYCEKWAKKNKDKKVFHNVGGYESHNRLNLARFEDTLKALHKIFLGLKKEDDSKIDDALLAYLDKQGDDSFRNSLILIDEAHLLFDVQRPHLVWFLSYQRHLFVDIVLSTQDLSLIGSKYTKFCEYFVSTVSTGMSITPGFFEYMYYSTRRKSKNTRFRSEKILKSQDIFSLYQSGDRVGVSSFYLRGLLSIAGFFLFAYFYWQWFSGSSSSDQKPNVNTDISKEIQQTTNTAVKSPQKNEMLEDKEEDEKYFVFKCNRKYCKSKDFRIPMALFKKRMNFDVYHFEGRTIYQSSTSKIEERVYYIISTPDKMNLYDTFRISKKIKKKDQKKKKNK